MGWYLGQYIDRCISAKHKRGRVSEFNLIVTAASMNSVKSIKYSLENPWVPKLHC